MLHELFPQAHVYTFEASFYGFRREKTYETTVQEFTVESYKKIGRDLLQGYLDYININNRNQYEVRDQLLREIVMMSRNTIIDDDGSDSEPEQDSPDTNPIGRQQEVRVLASETYQPVRFVRSSQKLKVFERETKLEKAKKSVEISTQT